MAPWHVTDWVQETDGGQCAIKYRDSEIEGGAWRITLGQN